MTHYQSPVNHFLQLCLRGRWDSKALQAAREMAAADNLDWDTLRQIVYVETLEPLAYQIVRGKNLVPTSVEEDWRRAYYHNACRNTLLLRELGEILHHLAEKGVEAIALKGAALAEIVYGDIAARPMSDLDLLIQPQDLSVTRQILAGLGYAPTGVEMHAGFTEEFRNEEILYKGGLVNTCVDLHWRLIAPVYYQRTFSTDWFWETALPAKINGTPTLVLGTEAQIVYLCAHLMLHHGGKSLFWLHDIAEVVTFYQAKIDWELILIKAKEYDLVLSVQQILLRVADEWDIPIPTKVLERLRALQPSQDEVRTFTWQNETQALRLFADLAGAKDWRQQLRIAWNTIFPTRAYMQHRYRIPHPILLPLYYPYRWLRGLMPMPGNR
jgi:Uncharacterised nucleotidyltransferase